VVFTAGHAAAMAAGGRDGVGWRGALVPLAGEYRPVPVALGVLAAESALLAAVTALAAGRLGAHWAIVHRFAAVVLALAWTHAVLAGSDSPGLQWFYLLSAAPVVAKVANRHLHPPLRSGSGDTTTRPGREGTVRWVAE